MSEGYEYISPEYQKAVEAAYIKKSAEDFLLFARGLTIPSAWGPRLFNQCIAGFQQKFFQDVCPSMTALRDGELPPARRFWVERTKKSAKDSDLAICILWLIAFPRRPILVQVCAANLKQAGIIKRRAMDILHYNPWLNHFVQIQQNRVINKDRLAECIIEATDSTGGAHGETPDLLILNELVHVAKWQAMEDHMNNADGVPQGVVIVSTNAGFKGTKSEVWRTNAIKNQDKWRIHIWDKVSPWLDENDVKDAARRNTPSEYNRLWKGIWSSGKGDALSDVLIDSCFDHSLKRLLHPEEDWVYIAGLDLGISHDHSGVVILGVNTVEQKFRVGYIKSWKPTVPNDKGNMEVDIMEVEKTCVRLADLFQVIWFGYDPAAGGSFIAQRLRRMGVPMREVTFAGQNLGRMAVGLKQSMEDGILKSFEDEALRRDFGKFNIVKKSYGYKLEAVSDEHGHADVGTALVICLPTAMDMIGGWGSFSKHDVIAYDDLGEPLSNEEIEDLHPDLRDIFAAYDEIEKEAKNNDNNTLWKTNRL